MSKHPINQALTLLKDGDKASNNKDFSKALSNFQEAVRIAYTIPENEWDKKSFMAVCNSRLAGAYGGLGKFEECLECANKSLDVLDKVGYLYPNEFGWWFGAKYNKGAALTELGRYDEAVKVVKSAKVMLSSEHGHLNRQCDQLINTIKNLNRRGKSRWKFWQ